MKRTERHHLKQNEFQHITLQVMDLFAAKRREVTTILLVLAVVGLGGASYWAWHQHTQDKAHALLAEAMVVQEARVGPPAEATGGSGVTYPTERERTQDAVKKYRVAADAYPSTDAGVFARYQEASLQVSLGNAADAIKAYQSVVDRAGDGLYGQMSKLGLAEAYSRSGQYEQAITAYKELAQRKDGQLPIDGILIQLGRTYRDAGKASDAQQTFNRLVEEFPDSPFTADAKREIDALKKTTKA
jgi:tetratricopeptide (TPR) repeat protein